MLTEALSMKPGQRLEGEPAARLPLPLFSFSGDSLLAHTAVAMATVYIPPQDKVSAALSHLPP